MDAEEAPAAAADLGFPVAIKLNHKNIAHKTELGLLRLQLMTENGRRCRRRDNHRACRKPSTKTSAATNSLIEQMIEPVVAELLVNIVNDSKFGHVLTLGTGGMLVELMRDTRTLLLPTSRKEISQAIAGLRVSTLMAGFRPARPL